MKYWRVQIGYSSDNFISVDEAELGTALRAQITGKVGIFKEGTVTGRNIMSITPDYNRMLGYARDYKLMGEDYERLGSKKLEEHRKYLENIKTSINKELGSAREVPLLGN